MYRRSRTRRQNDHSSDWSKHHSCSLDDRDRAEYLSIHHKDTTQVLILCWDAASQIWIIFSVVHKQTLASSTFIRFLWTLSMGQLKRHQITLLFKDGVQYKPWHVNTDASRWDVPWEDSGRPKVCLDSQTSLTFSWPGAWCLSTAVVDSLLEVHFMSSSYCRRAGRVADFYQLFKDFSKRCEAGCYYHWKQRARGHRGVTMSGHRTCSAYTLI